METALQEVKQLRQQCQQLLEERGRLEDSPAAMMARVLICRGLQKNEESELATKSAQQDRDAKDMLQQFEEPLGMPRQYRAAVRFEREKEDEIREYQEEVAQLPLHWTFEDHMELQREL